MGEVEQVDGSAMGMLLLLRDNCGSENCDVTVTRCSPEILRLFKTANLDNYFNFR
jgi:anti-anti-sigma regulatory factor